MDIAESAPSETRKNNRWTRFILILFWFLGYQWAASLAPRISDRGSDTAIMIATIIVFIVGYLFGKYLAHINIWKMVIEIGGGGAIAFLLYNYTFFGGSAHSNIGRVEDVLVYVPYAKEALYVTMVTLFGGFAGYAFKQAGNRQGAVTVDRPA